MISCPHCGKPLYIGKGSESSGSNEPKSDVPNHAELKTAKNGSKYFQPVSEGKKYFISTKQGLQYYTISKDDKGDFKRTYSPVKFDSIDELYSTVSKLKS